MFLYVIEAMLYGLGSFLGNGMYNGIFPSKWKSLRFNKGINDFNLFCLIPPLKKIYEKKLFYLIL